MSEHVYAVGLVCLLCNHVPNSQTFQHKTPVGRDGYCRARPASSNAGTLLVRRSACLFCILSFVLFICMPRVACATLAMYIGRSLRGGERSLRFFRPLTRCARYATCIDTYGSSARSLAVPVLQPPYPSSVCYCILSLGHSLVSNTKANRQ